MLLATKSLAQTDSLRVFGGLSVLALQSGTNPAEKRTHDATKGLDFGSPDDILLVYQQKEHSENLIEHPRSRNTREKRGAILPMKILTT